MVVICPPGATLVIIGVMLGDRVEPPTVGLESEVAVTTVELVNRLDDMMRADDGSFL
jgi:hypothetical protein